MHKAEMGMAILQALRRAALFALLPGGAWLLAGCNGSGDALAPSRAPYTLGGAITGLNSAGLILANGSTQASVAAGASAFTLPIPVVQGVTYAVTVAAQPAGLTCTVSHGMGTMPANDVFSVAVTCAENAYSLGGTVAGLTVGGLVLGDGGDQVTVAANATVFTLPVAVAYSSSYSVTVATQPTGLTCSVSRVRARCPRAMSPASQSPARTMPTI
jgi:hypothetical protein